MQEIWTPPTEDASEAQRVNVYQDLASELTQAFEQGAAPEQLQDAEALPGTGPAARVEPGVQMPAEPVALAPSVPAAAPQPELPPRYDVGEPQWTLDRTTQPPQHHPVHRGRPAGLRSLRARGGNPRHARRPASAMR